MPRGQVLLSKLFPLFNGNFKIEADLIHINAIPIRKPYSKPPFYYWFGKPGFPHKVYNMNFNPIKTVNLPFPFPVKFNPNVIAKLPINNIKPGLLLLERPKPGYEAVNSPLPEKSPIKMPNQGYQHNEIPWKQPTQPNQNIVSPWNQPKPNQGNQHIVSPWKPPNQGYQHIESPWKRPNQSNRPNETLLQQAVLGLGYQMSNYPKNEIESSLLENQQKLPVGSQNNYPKLHTDQEGHQNSIYVQDKYQKPEWTANNDKTKVPFNALLNQYHKFEQQMSTGNEYVNADNGKDKVTFKMLMDQYNALEKEQTKDKYSGLELYPNGPEQTGNKVSLAQLYNDYNKIKQQMGGANGYVSTDHINKNQHENNYSKGVSYPVTTLPPPMTTASTYLDKVDKETKQYPVTTPHTETKNPLETTAYTVKPHLETTLYPTTTPYPVTPQPDTNFYHQTTTPHYKTMPYHQTTQHPDINGLPKKEDNIGKTATSNTISTLSTNLPNQRPVELLPFKTTTNDDKSSFALPFRIPYDNQVLNENTYGSYGFPSETDNHSESKDIMLPGGSTYPEKPVLPFVDSAEYKPVPQAEKSNAKTESKSIPFEKPSGFHLFETTLIPFPTTPGPMYKK